MKHSKKNLNIELINNKVNKSTHISNEIKNTKSNEIIKVFKIDNYYKNNNYNYESYIFFLIIHIIYCYIFGILIFLPMIIFYKTKIFKFLKSLNLFNISKKCIFLNLYWIIFLILIYLKFIIYSRHITDIFLYYYIIFMLAGIINYILKYSKLYSINYNIIINNKKIDDFNFINFNIKNLNNIKKETDKLYENNNIDTNNFHLSFFQNLTYLKEIELNINNNFFYIEYNDNFKTKYHSCKNIFDYLLLYYLKKLDKFIYFKLIIITFFLNIFMFIGIHYNNKISLFNNIKPLLGIFFRYKLYLIINNTFIIYLLFYYSKIFTHLYINNNILNQISWMININNNNKIIPTINFLDNYSIQNWLNLKKITNNFGSRLFIRYRFIMSITFVLIILKITIIILFSFRNYLKININYNLKIAEFENFIIKDWIILFYFLIKILLVFSYYNYTYVLDKKNLNIILEKISYINIFKSGYIKISKEQINYKKLKFNYNYDKISYQLNNSDPNYFYTKIIDYFIKKYDNNIIEEINNNIKNLYDFIENKINHLEFLKNRKCFRIFGILINNSFLKIIIFGLIPYLINYIIWYKIDK